MPQEAEFNKDTLYDRPVEEKLVRLWAKQHVEDKHLVGVLRALEACQHDIHQTKGFTFHQNRLRYSLTILGSKDSAQSRVSQTDKFWHGF
ncbi:Hypothetical protein SCF082_LOCUS44672, partial [Durusdinium trenchii]